MDRAGLLFSGNSLVWGRMAHNAIDHRRGRRFLLRDIFAVREGFTEELECKMSLLHVLGPEFYFENVQPSVN